MPQPLLYSLGSRLCFNLYAVFLPSPFPLPAAASLGWACSLDSSCLVLHASYSPLLCNGQVALSGLSWELPIQTHTQILTDELWPLGRIEAALEKQLYVYSLTHPLTHLPGLMSGLWAKKGEAPLESPPCQIPLLLLCLGGVVVCLAERCCG